MHLSLFHYTDGWTIFWIIAAACILSTVRYIFGRFTHKHRQPVPAPIRSQEQVEQDK